MKVTFDKAKLLAALLPAAGISQVKNTLTTVEGLLFECPPREKYGKFEGDLSSTCRISAFDLDKGLQTPARTPRSPSFRPWISFASPRFISYI